jgi:hypothetical protein
VARSAARKCIETLFLLSKVSNCYLGLKEKKSMTYKQLFVKTNNKNVESLNILGGKSECPGVKTQLLELRRRERKEEKMGKAKTPTHNTR